MKIAMVNTYDLSGGAARAAYRLHRGLVRAGVESRMLVQYKLADDATVMGPASKWGRGLALVRPRLDALPLGLYRKREPVIFSPAILPGAVAAKAASMNPDIVHLHWVAGGFLRIEGMGKFTGPIVWTLHDMWAFTGGCHYDAGCGRYIDSCGRCPMLKSRRQNDLSNRVWRRKSRAWASLDITVVTPSRWLAGCARKSSLFKDRRVEVIPNGLDTGLYKPADRRLARQRFGLPEDKKLILFGAESATSDRRKGFHLLIPALKVLGEEGLAGSTELVVFGASAPAHGLEFGLRVRYMGELHDDISLALLYAAADVFVLPSMEDNLPNTVMESLACGTPVVAFKTGGIPDMIEHGVNGYLADAFDTAGLASGIRWVLEDSSRAAGLGRTARGKAVREYDTAIQARRYLDLYEEILKGRSTGDKQKGL
jgi:glycosyltransferase involved in cell wall biosynthesis